MFLSKFIEIYRFWMQDFAAYVSEMWVIFEKNTA